MTIGYFFPCLILPVRLLPDEENPEWLSENLRYVLRHEYAHIQKRDLWLKALYLVGAVFPVVQPAGVSDPGALNEDIELATDEEVAKDLAKKSGLLIAARSSRWRMLYQQPPITTRVDLQEM